MAQRTSKPHPCLSCGACCSIYRVAFSRSETSIESWAVPEDLAFSLNQDQLAMKTKSPQNLRCQALRGQLGYHVSCSIYTNRPSPCRRFQASFEDGRHQPRCDDARAVFGFRPLTIDDFANEHEELVSF